MFLRTENWTPYKYDELRSKLVSVRDDIALLSAKKPHDQLNSFKLKFINNLLAQVNDLIGDFRPEEDFKQFDKVELPSNSDVLMMLNLYLTGMIRFKEANSIRKVVGGEFSDPFTKEVWNTED